MNSDVKQCLLPLAHSKMVLKQLTVNILHAEHLTHTLQQ